MINYYKISKNIIFTNISNIDKEKFYNNKNNNLWYNKKNLFKLKILIKFFFN